MSDDREDAVMGSRSRQDQLAARAARRALDYVAEEIHGGRADRNLAQKQLGVFAGMSRQQVSRAERGVLKSLTIAQAAHLLAGLGLRLSIKAYPAGEPIRDAPQQALLGEFRALLHAAVAWAREVPFAIEGDLRAWDARISRDGWRYGVESETRPRDFQALVRRLALKRRDGDVDGVILVLRDSAANRDLLERHAADLAAAFPIEGTTALRRLAAGEDPRGSAIVLVATAPSVAGRRANPGTGRRTIGARSSPET